MGLAEITPGISGATVAGLFNVYNEFVRIVFQKHYDEAFKT